MKLYIWRTNYISGVNYDDREVVAIMTDQGTEHARSIAKLAYFQDHEYESNFLDESPEIYNAEKVVLL